MKNRELAQTIESTPKRHKKAAAEKVSAPVEAPIAPAPLPTAEPVALQPTPTSPAAENASRDRRGRDERRGRYLEKAPPGTRTKMLKIIYDKRSTMLERQRRRRLMNIGIAAVVAVLGMGFALEAKNFMTKHSAKVWEEGVNWWDHHAQHEPSSKPKATRSSRR